MMEEKRKKRKTSSRKQNGRGLDDFLFPFLLDHLQTPNVHHPSQRDLAFPRLTINHSWDPLSARRGVVSTEQRSFSKHEQKGGLKCSSSPPSFLLLDELPLTVSRPGRGSE